MNKFYSYIREKKFFMESFYLTYNNGITNRLINFFFLSKLLINFIIRFAIYSEVLFKNLFYKKINQNININIKSKICFIFGNGPSFKEFDLRKVKNKDTFFVNEAFKHRLYGECNPKYHCILDGYMINPTLNGCPITAYNKISFKRLRLIKNDFKILNEIKNNSKIILPYQFSRLSQEKFGFLNKKKIFYVKMLSHQIDDYIPSNLSLNSGVPLSINVIPWVICIALAMDYKKIILFSTEQDLYLKNNSTSIRNKRYYKKFLDSINNIKNKSKKALNLQCSNYIGILTTQKILLSHINLLNYSKKKGSKIINCTPGGILDMYKEGSINNYI
jgi:hypothetical protein